MQGRKPKEKHLFESPFAWSSQVQGFKANQVLRALMRLSLKNKIPFLLAFSRPFGLKDCNEAKL